MVNRLLVVVLSLLFSCNKAEIIRSEEPHGYLEAHKENFIKEKEVKRVAVQARFLEPYNAALNQLGDKVYKIKAKRDSVLSLNANALSFVVSFNSLDKVALSKVNIYTPEEYHQRIYQLAYDMAAYFSITTSSGTLQPVMVTTDYQMDAVDGIKFLVQFEVDSDLKKEWIKKEEDIKLSFNDPFWQLGKLNFTYKAHKILDLNTL